jgi:hypothetical protein
MIPLSKPWEPHMRHDFDYGGYHVYCDAKAYVAETPADEDLGAFLQLRSRLLQRVINAVDDIEALTDAIDDQQSRKTVMPRWLGAWVHGEATSINLDADLGKTQT